jgi:hypothetical protein
VASQSGVAWGLGGVRELGGGGGVAVFLASSSTANPCTVVHVGFHAWRSSSSSSNQAQQVEGIDELWSEQGGYWEM